MGILDGFDPATQGLLAAAFQGLQASGPSRMPQSLGQIIGQAGSAGMNEYQQAMLMAQKKKQAEALMALEQQKAEMERLKAARMAKEQAGQDAFQQQFSSGAFTKSAAEQALAGGGGPTVENAGLLGNFKPKLDRGLMYEGMIKNGLIGEGVKGLTTMDEAALTREGKIQDRLMQLDAAAQNAALSREDRAQRAKEASDLRRDLQQNSFAQQRSMAGLAASMRQPPAPPAPIVQTDEKGNTKIYDRSGNLVKDLGATGKPSAAFAKGVAAKQKANADIGMAITELEKATADGGLIDKSTGSGAGALVDTAAGFIGKATPGAVAVGQMKPIFDMVLKMVPRFEGPQSDKDTASYRDAAGNLANPAVPNALKKKAGKEILRLMKERRTQFIPAEIAGTEADVPSTSVESLLEKYK